VRLRGSGGLSLAGDAFGDAAAPPVLLLHGGGQTRHAWGGTARALGARGWRALALDLRGHGESDWSPEGRYGLDDFVADLRCVIADLGRRPVLVGASLGGMTALAAEGEAPGTAAAAIVLVDIAPRLEPEGVQRIIAFMRAHVETGFASLEEAAAAVATYLPHRARPADSSGLARNLRRGADGRLRWHWDPRFLAGTPDLAAPRTVAASPQPGEAAGPSPARPERLLEAARGLRVPTLLVRGARSEIVSADGAAELLGVVPGARVVDVAEAGHMVAGDRNDVFTDAVVAFLDELRGS
jgi:pimeloyl-ACP methyl ester carboxylesterase